MRQPAPKLTGKRIAQESSLRRWTTRARELVSSRRWTEALFVQRRRLRLRYRALLWIAAALLAWGLRGVYFPWLTRPLIANYHGEETEVLLVEGWIGVTREKAREIAPLSSGREVIVLLDSESWLDAYAFEIDRGATTRRNLVRAGVAPNAIEIVATSVGDCELGCTGVRAREAAEMLQRKGISTATLVGEGLHSARSCYAYRAALGPAISLDCYPTAVGPRWQRSWQRPYGVLEVVLEYTKFGYYLARGVTGWP